MHFVTTGRTTRSILLGMAGFFGAYYSVSVNTPPLSITILWSYFLPLLASMAYGAKYGLIAGIVGLGAFFPFVLWPTNGWANWVTAILYILLYSWVGYFATARERLQSGWNHPLFIALPFLLFYFPVTIILYPVALSFNPPFWEPAAINSVPAAVLQSVLTKGVLLMYLIVICNVGMLKIPVVRYLLGLPVTMESRLNGRIFGASLLGCLGLWYILIIFNRIFIDKTFPQGLTQIVDPREIIGLIIFVAAGFFVGYLASLSMEFRLSVNQNLAAMNESLELHVAERTAELTAAQQILIAQNAELEKSQETQRRSAEIQSVLRQIAEAAVMSPSMGELYRTVHGLVRRVLPANQFSINLLDEAAGDNLVPFCAGEVNFIPEPMPLDKGLMEYTMQLGKAAYLTPAAMDHLRESGNYLLDKTQMTQVPHYLGAPLIDSKGKVFGAMSLLFGAQAQPIQQEYVEVFSIIAVQVSMAIERKQAEAALQASQARYRALMEQSFEALALVEIDTRKIVEVNHRYTELLGYSLPEDAPLNTNNVLVDLKCNIDELYNNTLKNQRITPAEAVMYYHKNGTKVHVERAGTVINIGGRNYYLISLRDMTAERRRQAALSRDAAMARRVQKGLLPEVAESTLVSIRTLYHPTNFVSGDSYYLEWRNEGKLLRGFLIDVSGHGLATAIQTSSINVLLREAANSDLTLLGVMRRVNARAAKYFTDDAYAAIIGFELDLSQRELRYAGAGITQFYVNGRKVETPGMFVGMWDDPEFSEGRIAFSAGDGFVFVTDGFTDGLEQPETADFLPGGKEFEANVEFLERLAASGKLRDDATAVCLKINV